VVLQALRLAVLLGRGRGLELHVGVADAEDVGGHLGLCVYDVLVGLASGSSDLRRKLLGVDGGSLKVLENVPIGGAG